MPEKMNLKMENTSIDSLNMSLSFPNAIIFEDPQMTMNPRMPLC